MSTSPVIGITSDIRVEKRTLGFVFTEYVDMVLAAGGLPLQIPAFRDATLIPTLLEKLDGVVIVGGEDIDPALYGEEPLPTQRGVPTQRLSFDTAFARAVIERRVPVLGICYGCQILTVVGGGALVQDIPTQIGSDVAHAGSFPHLPQHEIRIEPNTRLSRILGAERTFVNSAHHQAPQRLPADWIESAHSTDGVIEAFEAPGDTFVVGVEWHPELMRDDLGQKRLFSALVEAARRG